MKILLIVNLCLTVYLLILFKKEQRKTKVLCGFVAAAIKQIANQIRIIEQHKDTSIGYSLMIGEAKFNLEEDEEWNFNAKRFIRNNWFLFGEKRNGFSKIYSDLLQKMREESKKSSSES